MILTSLVVKPPKDHSRNKARRVLVVKRSMQNPPQIISIVEYPLIVFIPGNVPLMNGDSCIFCKTLDEANEAATKEAISFN